ncbi:MAG TPA: alpha/beta hydrolase [Rhodanobacteraceae bacterium]|nr:alpha/beta hydrolase [Rhodanobacteraceae bacterium]
MRAEELRIGRGERALAALAWGDPANPPMLALHGWLDNAGSFSAIAPLLARTHYVVAVDLGGHGRSSHLPAGAWYHYVDYFDDLRATLDHFGWPKATLFGHSLGGTLASLFAAAYPERVESLLLVEALGPLTVPPEKTLEQLKRGLDERAAFANRRALRVFRDLDAAIEARATASGFSSEVARALVERGVEEVEGGYVWSSDPRLTLTSAQRYSEAQVLAMLGGIRAPTLLILAEPATSYLPDAMMQSRAAQVANIEVVHVGGHHHHHLHLESPDAVFEIVRRFLAALSERSGKPNVPSP